LASKATRVALLSIARRLFRCNGAPHRMPFHERHDVGELHEYMDAIGLVSLQFPFSNELEVAALSERGMVLVDDARAR
jgi:hypothetical protein